MLIGADQISDHEILGTPIPPQARPIFRALSRRDGVLFARSKSRVGQLEGALSASPVHARPDETAPAMAPRQRATQLVGQLLHGPAERVDAAALSTAGS